MHTEEAPSTSKSQLDADNVNEEAGNTSKQQQLGPEMNAEEAANTSKQQLESEVNPEEAPTTSSHQMNAVEGTGQEDGNGGENKKRKLFFIYLDSGVVL